MSPDAPVVQDPWNPTEDEVRAWACAGEPEPEEDWDLALSGAGHHALYLDLAADPACPSRGCFLRVLYLIVGDAVRTGFATLPRDEVKALLEAGRARGRPELVLWAERSRALLARPETFRYDAWCDGGLARTPGG